MASRGRGRVGSPTGVDHASFRGNGGERIYRTPADYDCYLDLFEKTLVRFEQPAATAVIGR